MQMWDATRFSFSVLDITYLIVVNDNYLISYRFADLCTNADQFDVT